MKDYKKKEVVIEELKKLFDIENNLEKGSYEKDGEFGISKKQMERFEVIDTLKDYFSNTVVEDGFVKVGSITFVHTDFEVCSGKPY
jgi:rRNA-processing protein FCF1